jgi:hypothetical protein
MAGITKTEWLNGEHAGGVEPRWCGPRDESALAEADGYGE